MCGLGRGVPVGFAGQGDESWLYHGTVVGGLITLVIMIVTYALGDTLPLRTVRFNLLYSKLCHLKERKSKYTIY